MLGVNMDVTARKRAEEAAQDNDRRIHAMADSAPVMICCSGPDGKATFFNECWLRFTGRERDQPLGDGWIEDVHPEDRQQALAEIASAAKERRYCHAEYRLRRADGEFRLVSCNGNPRFDADGGFAGYLASAIDITDLAQSLEGATARQKLEGVGVLAGEIAHDLNNMLGGILSESEPLETDLRDDSSAREGIGRIKLAADRAVKIVRQLLAYGTEERQMFKPRSMCRRWCAKCSIF